MLASDRWYQSTRLGGLRRFAIAISVLNILGHTVFGFEQSWAQPLVGLASAYATEILLESIEAYLARRTPRFAGGAGGALVDFLLPAHITGLAVSMLLYANERLLPIAFAAVVAICSKHVLRVQIGPATRHFLNPSNFGITLTLLLFPWVGIAPPYHFTENLIGIGDWIVPAIIVASGTALNARFALRLPVVAAWLAGFVGQALIRSVLLGTPIVPALLPMTGVAFLLYTFYMVTDPATTPDSARGQIAFGTAVAATYGLLQLLHVVFGLFFALTIVSGVRGLGLYLRARAAERSAVKAPVPTSLVLGRTEP